MMTQRSVGDPWYTVLYREPAKLWWITPLPPAAAWVAIGLLWGRPAVGLWGALAMLAGGAVQAIVRLGGPDDE